jgi:cyclophilin family peptidyl-prolyl cis-trans isomerase
MMKAIKIPGLLLLGLIAANSASAQSEATFYTSMGNFTIDLTDTLTPVTVDSFIARTAGKFYDGLTFHRVINNFMIQGGDPNGDGSGDAGYIIPDEFVPSLKNVPKALAMANAGPNTGSCQFFINLVTNSHLDNKHTVFGMVTKNFSVVQNIGLVPTSGNPNNKPVTDVKIDSIRITRFPATVGNIAGEKPIHIFPNPGHGVFTIELPNTSTKIEIVNSTGQVVHKTKGKGTIKVDLSNQPAGMYIARFSTKHGTAQSRIVIQ